MAQRASRDADFAAFVAGASASLGRTAWLLTGDADAAAELLQTSLVKTYLAWSRIRPDGALAHARRVLVKLDIAGHRAGHGTVAMAEEPERAVGDGAGAHAGRERLGRVLATLPARQRRVVVLRYLHDLSEADVAAELGLPLGTVTSNAAPGLVALRAALGQEEDPVGFEDRLRTQLHDDPTEVRVDLDAVLDAGREAVRGRRLGWTVAGLATLAVVASLAVTYLLPPFVPAVPAPVATPSLTAPPSPR